MKITGIVLLSAAIVAAALWLSFLAITQGAVLDEKKLTSVSSDIALYDINGEKISAASLSKRRGNVSLKEIPSHTLNAFIASEDRNFYSHGGLNYRRMAKALYKNVVSRSFKEGASTISQQLVKNTHLSNEKTITRKLKEIRLTKELEKRYQKDEILEMYLNTIYFGHNCYGIAGAAEFYFGKKPSELDLNESAVLAGLLSSPNNYSPFKNPEKCLARRNIVLKAMLACNFIDSGKYETTAAEPINVKSGGNAAQYSDYVNCVFDELEDSGLDVYYLNGDCKIYTYMDKNLQKAVESIDYPCDRSVVVTDNSGGVSAFTSTIGNAKRQPGSTIKPLAVYGPAIEEKLIHTSTKIADEKTDYNGYSPENNDGKYHGYVTVTDSICQSYNIPAVKVLNEIKPELAEKYLKNMRIELEESDKNLSLALGGMTYGITLKNLADSYSVFANGGVFQPSHFIKKIVDRRGNVIYGATEEKYRVFSEGTCSLLNEAMLETSKRGTAKKLKNLVYDVASKTGTCGNKDGNTDAYSVNYTSENCVAVWLGDKNNKRADISGGKDCCKISAEILSKLYSSHTPAPLETEKGTKTVEIDADDYNSKNKIVIADPLSPQINKLKIKVLENNLPKEHSTKFSRPEITEPEIFLENNAVNIQLCQTKYYSYLINRAKNGKNELIYDGKWIKNLKDEPEEGTYLYSVTPYYSCDGKRYYGEKICLPAVKIGEGGKAPQVKIPDIINEDWYNR